MHIPEGYLGPQTYGAAYAAMTPIWLIAGGAVRRALSHRMVSTLAMGAAFSFIVMMFNVPIPGGSTGHATGGALIAILLGPWAAVLAMSVVLAVQALLFQDGGITALGANCLNMAFVLPVTSYAVYRLIAANSAAGSRRRVIAAGVAGYVGLNAAALTTGIMFGLQPLLAHAPDGRPLYAPYGLSVAVPAMVVSHLLVFGVVEGIVTALAYAYVSAVEPDLVRPPAAAARRSRRGLVWAGVALLAVLTPLGIWLPERLGAKVPWGEWGAGDLQRMVGFVPRQLGRMSELWQAPIPDYAPRGWEEKPFAYQGAAYIASAFLGVAACFALIWMLSRWLPRTGSDSDGAKRPHGPPPSRPGGESGALPSWLSESAAPRRSRGSGRSRFVERSIQDSARLVEEVVFAERVAREPGFLQGLDARAKLLSLVGLLVAASLLRHIPSLCLLAIFAVLAAALSRLRVGVLLSRAWWFIPMTFVVIALPATLNVITPGDSVLVIHSGTSRWLPEIAITRQGLAGAGLLIARIFTGVLLALTLSLTTRWQELLRAAYTKVTAPFVMIVAVMYRYLFVLLRTVEEMHLARRARSISPGSLADQHRWVGNRIAVLYSRSRRLSEEMYQAMVARGYAGQPRAIATARLRIQDGAWLGICAAIIALSLFVDRALVAGLPW